MQNTVQLTFLKNEMATHKKKKLNVKFADKEKWSLRTAHNILTCSFISQTWLLCFTTLAFFFSVSYFLYSGGSLDSFSLSALALYSHCVFLLSLVQLVVILQYTYNNAMLLLPLNVFFSSALSLALFFVLSVNCNYSFFCIWTHYELDNIIFSACGWTGGKILYSVCANL